MSGFVFFAIIIFVVIPIIKNIASAKPAQKPVRKSGSGSGQKNWAQVQEVLQQKIQEQARQQSSRRATNKRDARGHSDARKQTHTRMHSRDGDTEVFPETHMARVRKRDQHDRTERNRIEAMLHSKKNRSIFRDGNKSVDTWGERGDAVSGGGWLFLLLFGLIAVFVVSKITPDLWTDIMRSLNIK